MYVLYFFCWYILLFGFYHSQFFFKSLSIRWFFLQSKKFVDHFLPLPSQSFSLSHTVSLFSFPSTLFLFTLYRFSKYIFTYTQQFFECGSFHNWYSKKSLCVYTCMGNRTGMNILMGIINLWNNRLLSMNCTILLAVLTCAILPQ